MCYFLRKGKLPWDVPKPKLIEIDLNHYKAADWMDENQKKLDDHKAQTTALKQSTSLEELCKGLPE
jgi:hypothetical protein